jgi:hypothetical protein
MLHRVMGGTTNQSVPATSARPAVIRWDMCQDGWRLDQRDGF